MVSTKDFVKLLKDFKGKELHIFGKFHIEEIVSLDGFDNLEVLTVYMYNDTKYSPRIDLTTYFKNMKLLKKLNTNCDFIGRLNPEITINIRDRGTQFFTSHNGEKIIWHY
jgi:hypothetical protein